MRTEALVKFIVMREHVRMAKETGLPAPWTTDHILQSYSFCNINRENDTVTKWITTNWREPLSMAERDDLWFWMFVARVVNWPDTLAELTGMAIRGCFDPDEFKRIVRARMGRGAKAWGGAYIVSTNGRTLPKEEYIAEFVLEPARNSNIDTSEYTTLKDICVKLMTLNGVSGFMAGQIIADAKYGDPNLLQATDWETFGISGPGSRRGLNRVCDRNKDLSWKEVIWHSTLLELRHETNEALATYGIAPLHAQDLQNCLCEFDKYERTRLGEGRPRATYPGA